MATTTTYLGLTKPATADRNWGATLNADLDLIDGAVVLRSGSTFTDTTATVVFHTGTTHGTQIGAGPSELTGFWGVLPTAQPAGAAQGSLTDNSGGDVSAFTLDAAGIPTALTDNSGGVVSGTIAYAMNTTALFDSTTGTAGTAVGDVGSTFNQSMLNNVHATLLAQLSLQRAWNVVVINAVASLANKVNGNSASLQKAGNNLSRVARLLAALRSAMVASGLAKGSA